MHSKTKLPIERMVRDFIRRRRLVRPGVLVVAVSGGPDSVCLLHVLLELRAELGISLHVAHLNHGLRGEESAADAAYVAALAERLGLPATVETVDTGSFRSGRRLSLEEAAREVRYRFLSEVACAVSARSVATGHTADDQVETILMHMVRGCGTRGLKGMEPFTRWRANDSDGLVEVIRPLLGVFRESTMEYCRRRGLEPRMDSTNRSPTFLRNRVRAELVPLLRRYNPRAREALLQLSRIAGDEHDFIAGQGRSLARRLVKQEGQSLSLDLARLVRLPPALQRIVLFDSLERLRGSKTDIEASHVEEMMAALAAPSGTAVSLPGGLVFYREYRRCVIADGEGLPQPFPVIPVETELLVPGVTSLPGWRVETTILPGMAADGDSPFTAYLAGEVLGKGLAVRARRPGDIFQPLGMSGPKKLQDFMVDAKVPRRWRDGVPLVFASDSIAWVVGYRIAEWAKVVDHARPVVRLRFQRTAPVHFGPRRPEVRASRESAE